MEKDEFEARLSDIKQYMIPDFGLQDTSLIDDIMGNKDRIFLKPPVLTSRDSQANLASRNGHQEELDEDHPAAGDQQN